MTIFIAVFAWGIWGISDKKAYAEGASFWQVYLTGYAFPLVFVPAVIATIFFSHETLHLSRRLAGFSFATAVCYNVSIFAFLVALKRTEAGWLIGITSAYPVVTVLLSSVFLHEHVTFARAIATVIAMGGVAVMAWQKGSETLSLKDRIIVGISALAFIVMEGALGIFDKESVACSSGLQTALAVWTWMLILWVPLYFLGSKLEGKRVNVTNFPGRRWSLACALTLGTGNLAYALALAGAGAGYVMSLGGLSPLVTYVLSLVFLKEKFHATTLIGMVMVLLGGLGIVLYA